MALIIKNKNLLMTSFVVLSLLSSHNTAHSSNHSDHVLDNIEQHKNGWHSARSSKLPQVKIGISRKSKEAKKDPAEVFFERCEYSKDEAVRKQEKRMVQEVFNKFKKNDLKKARAVAQYAPDLITKNMGATYQIRIVNAFFKASADDVENITKNAKKLILDWMDINEKCGIIIYLCEMTRTEGEDIVGDIKKLTPLHDQNNKEIIFRLINEKERANVFQILLMLPSGPMETKADKLLGTSKANRVFGMTVENERKSFVTYALTFITAEGLQANERISLLELLSRAPEKKRQEISTSLSEDVQGYLKEIIDLSPRSRRGEFATFMKRAETSLEELNEKEENNCKNIVKTPNKFSKKLNISSNTIRYIFKKNKKQ
tara:strand:- start:2552 stop:3670 length:1119 start_codon:yes stop_codon:yes gene_type:complete